MSDSSTSYDEYRRRAEAEMGADIDLLDADGKKKSQVTLLIELAARWETFHDADDDAYAVIETGDARQVHPIRSRAYRRLLSRDFLELTGKGCNGNSISDALATIEARAIHHAERRDVYLRTAHIRFSHAATSKIILDIGDESWSVIEVTGDGWRVLDRSPVEFIRKGGVAPLPRPERGGSISELDRFLNVDPPQMRLAIGWILRALSGVGPYPVMVLQGEHGTGKSTATRVLRAFTDPSTVPLRAPPRDVSDLLVSAGNNHVVALDNLSGLNNELSDCLCRFATGGGLDKRKLFTDQEQILVDIQRPVIVNGIDDIATRPDLLSRAIVLILPVIDSRVIKSDEGFRREFDEAKPRIFGAILDALSCALRRVDTVRIERKPRMVDFALWATAAEPALGWADGAFMDAYDDMHRTAIIDGIDASPVGSTLVEYLRSIEPVDTWSPSPTHLFETLTERAGLRSKQKSWPHSPRGMGNILRRLAPSLRALGICFEQGSGTGHHDRSYRFYRVAEKAPNAPNAPKPSNGAASTWAHPKTDTPNLGASHGDTPKLGEAPTDAPNDAPTLKPSNGAASGDFWADLGASGAFSPTSPKKGEHIEGDRI